MSEEEKQAIEEFRKLVEAFKEARQDFGEDGIKDYIQIEKVDVLETILNLIEKQQEEIDQYKELDKKICNEELLDKNYVLENYISKDKIKSKIKELEEKDKDSINNVYGYGIYFLKELLEGE